MNVQYNSPMRILLVEDEERLSNNIKKGLTEQGFAVDTAYDGEEGEFLAETEEYDLILMDLMLPKKDGVSVCKSLRERKIKTPILMLTAKSQLEDKVVGFEAGADDYLTKPFAFEELKARIYALIRRSHGETETTLSVSDLQLDPKKHTVIRGDIEIKLTPKEFSVLEFLLTHKNEIVTRTQIIEHVWDMNFEGISNVVDVFITTLRKKIDKGNSKALIHTLHGVGYKISEKS